MIFPSNTVKFYQNMKCSLLVGAHKQIPFENIELVYLMPCSTASLQISLITYVRTVWVPLVSFLALLSPLFQSGSATLRVHCKNMTLHFIFSGVISDFSITTD